MQLVLKSQPLSLDDDPLAPLPRPIHEICNKLQSIIPWRKPSTVGQGHKRSHVKVQNLQFIYLTCIVVSHKLNTSFSYVDTAQHIIKNNTAVSLIDCFSNELCAYMCMSY